MSVFAGNINPLTGAQVAGPMRPMPPRRRPVNWASIPKAIREHNAAIDARRPGFGIQPGGNLARLLTAPGMTRPLRRRILAAVQMSPANKNRARLGRAIQRELDSRGI